MFGLGWFGTVLLILGLIVTAPVWLSLLGIFIEVALWILARIFDLIEAIIEEIVDCWQTNPKAASTVLGVAVLGAIFALAYFFS